MSILTGPEIRRRVAAGDIEIDPFVDAHVNPASVDLTLGGRAACYKIDLDDEERLEPHAKFSRTIHDARYPQEVEYYEFYGRDGFVVWPGHLYLMHTVECLCAKNLVSELTGKSSIARLGVVVHLTAGFGDPNFRGQYTLEVVSFRPVRLFAGMRICQMVFHEIVGEVESYQDRGHYVGDAARGPVPSMVHKQFEKKEDVQPQQLVQQIDALTPGERAYIEETIRHLGGK